MTLRPAKPPLPKCEACGGVLRRTSKPGRANCVQCGHGQNVPKKGG